MIGDYTKVPLRERDRWTGARMQQGRVLLEHEWNLNVDAAERAGRTAARDVIGPAGVPAGSDAFSVTVTKNPSEVTVRGGRIWVDGRCAFAPTQFRYTDQDAVPALPTSGKALVYLDVFPEHVQPGEAWEEIVDPALDPVEASARIRVGWRVRVAPTNAVSAQAALTALALPALSTGTLNINRTTPASLAASDPCDPPGDPLGLLPNGLFRVEVLDGGSAGTARFVWAADDGATTVRIENVSGNTVTLAPTPSVKLAETDLVEVSWLGRRADRVAHGELYRITGITPDASGDVLTLDRAAVLPVNARGAVVRRWEGSVRGAVNAVNALINGVDFGLRFSAATNVGSPPVAATYLTGDWWAAWLRPNSASGVEVLAAAPPDGVPHAFVALGLVDFGTGALLEDGRPKFPSLTNLPRSTCTVTAFPGDDLQAAANALPADGGELCLAAGKYNIAQPIRITNKRRIVVNGIGPATALTSTVECALLFENCQDVTVTNLRAEGGSVAEHLDGALTFSGCTRIRVSDCQLSCSDATGDTSQACLTVRPSPAGSPREIRVSGNRCEVGTRQIGILIVDGQRISVTGNDIDHVPTAKTPTFSLDLLASELARLGADIANKPPDGLPPRYDPLLVNLQTTLRNQAQPQVNQGIPLRVALRNAARDQLRDRGTAKAHELVGASGPSAMIAGGQGIVIGGKRADTVLVNENVITGLTQGIHVGTARVLASGVDIARNTVEVKLPALYNRGRHGIFVGNGDRIAVLDNNVTLRRQSIREFSPVDGIRVFGFLGTYVMVRESTLNHFPVPVRVTPRPGSTQGLWVVSDTLARDARAGVVAPSGVNRVQVILSF